MNLKRLKIVKRESQEKSFQSFKSRKNLKRRRTSMMENNSMESHMGLELKIMLMVTIIGENGSTD